MIGIGTCKLILYFLYRHVQLSDLHKTNMENLKKSKGGGDGAANSQQYRDRAKERRQKYGEPAVPAPNKLKVNLFSAALHLLDPIIHFFAFDISFEYIFKGLMQFL